MSSRTLRSTVLEDAALLVGRVVLGVVFIAHGWRKYDQGMGTTEKAFGALTSVVGVLLALSMLGAIWFVHLDAGLYVADGGYEFVLVLAVATALLATLGAGRLSVDGLLGRRRTA